MRQAVNCVSDRDGTAPKGAGKERPGSGGSAGMGREESKFGVSSRFWDCKESNNNQVPQWGGEASRSVWSTGNKWAWQGEGLGLIEMKQRVVNNLARSSRPPLGCSGA